MCMSVFCIGTVYEYMCACVGGLLYLKREGEISCDVGGGEKFNRSGILFFFLSSNQLTSLSLSPFNEKYQKHCFSCIILFLCQ